MTNTTTEIYYDEAGDFLEVFFGEPTKCYAEEPEPGIFIRKDQQTHEIKSIGLLSFKKRGVQALYALLARVNKRLPLTVSLP